MKKATKAQMIDFIHHNFTRGGKKITKKSLNDYSTEQLESIIIRNNCQELFEAWMNRPKLIKFMVDGVQNGKEYSWDCEYISEEECRKAFEDEGIEVIKIVKASNHHRCKYCNGIASGREASLLCDECRDLFGHVYYDEL